MPEQDIATIARTPHDAFNARQFERVAPLIAPDAKWVDMAAGVTYHGPSGFRQYQESWAIAFPDARIDVPRVRTGADFVLVEFVCRGTHTGPLTTPAGTIPPTSRTGEAPFCEIYEIRGGKIAGGASYYDSATLLRQLGLIPEGAAHPLGEAEYAR